MEQEQESRADVAIAAASLPEGVRHDDPAEALETFVRLANWGILHPEDLRRFDSFVTLAAAAGWLATEVEAKLLAAGLPAQLAQELRRRFWNRTKPFPTIGTGRRELDEQIRQMNARLTRRDASSHQE